MTFKREEYPRPQFQRSDWQSLNGEWEFDFLQGWPRDLHQPLHRRIQVPYSYQWEASGIHDTAVHPEMLYRRSFRIPQAQQDKRALLCFNAVDYTCAVWVNDRLAVTHEGGFTPFHTDITDWLREGENTITVYCRDTLDTAVPRGKQSWTGEPFGCFYYPNSGIWQSVWLEFFTEDCMEDYSLQADVDHCAIHGFVETRYGRAEELELTASYQGRLLKRQRVSLSGRRASFTLRLDTEAFDMGDLLWWPDNPRLIQVEMKLLKGQECLDAARSRVGLRKLSVENGQILLNNVPQYQRLVLDQGYWPESGLTPPDAEALKRDILLAKSMGFNGARKHQKLEDPYFYYYADELGFLTWCEMPSAYTFCDREQAAITAQWQELVKVARNFASVVAYVPLNESWGAREMKTHPRQQSFGKSLYYLTKSLDDTRLVSTNDGFENLEDSDILSIHDYSIREAAEFPEKYGSGYQGLYPQGWALFADGQRYLGQPVLLTEFGGIALADDEKGEAWGYGNGAGSEDDLIHRLQQLVDGILQTEFQGYCYTQLTDVQQEVNGLLRADRTPKASPERLKQIFSRHK